MKLRLALAALGVLAASAATAAGLESGMKVGERTTAFQVVDVTGPKKGSQLCYR